MRIILKPWPVVAALLLASLAALPWLGKQLQQQPDLAWPLPAAVVIPDGQVLYTGADIEHGREIWKRLRAQPTDHDAPRVSEWSIDWLRREATTMLELLARDEAAGAFATLGAERQAALKMRVARELRGNTHDAATGTITVSLLRATAMEAVASHYMSLFSNDPATAMLRKQYALPADLVPDMESRRQLTAFLWWSAWAEAIDRAGHAADGTQDRSQDALGWLVGLPA